MISHSFLLSLLSSLILFAAPFVRKDQDKYPAVCVAAGFSVFSMLISLPQIVTLWLHPHTLDAFLYRADLVLGLDPFALGRFVNSMPWLANSLVFCYDSITLMFAVVYVSERSPVLLRACVLAPVLAYIGYNLVPAVGPAHAFSGPATLLAIPENTPRNCFPSMHLGWALLIAWNTRHYLLKIAAWSFVVLTVLATVGLGEHYYVDLIAAVPFCLTVQWISVWLCNRQRVRSLERQAQYLLAHGGQAECQRDIAARCQELLRLRFAMGNRE